MDQFLSVFVTRLNPFSTMTRFHIHSADYLEILYTFRNSCGRFKNDKFSVSQSVSRRTRLVMVVVVVVMVVVVVVMVVVMVLVEVVLFFSFC
ncbi:hypothetical protein E2C01_040779 [Portunus trituberculatus]|uniref:Uncharacterized protein n=1 Tax=Portunus trituberculatus TaxID=210409 RepID=A0A5B7FNI2_PORTR|nr:hypothetical protein [Portunus trituberculatus]